MAIAAKRSRRFYETLGDEAAENMIDWMQGVDAHRTELRELHDLSFDRFDARLGERLAEFRPEMLDEMRREMRQEIRTEVGQLRDEMRAEFASQRHEMRADIARVSTRIDDRYADLIKWSFAFWIGSVVTLILGMAAITRIGH